MIFLFLRRSQEQLTITTLYHPLMTHSILVIHYIYIYIFTLFFPKNKLKKPETTSYYHIKYNTIQYTYFFNTD